MGNGAAGGFSEVLSITLSNFHSIDFRIDKSWCVKTWRSQYT